MSSPIASVNRKLFDNILIFVHQFLSHKHRVEVLSNNISHLIHKRFSDVDRVLCLDVGCGDMNIAETIQKNYAKTIWNCIDIHDLPEHMKGDTRWSKYKRFNGRDIPFADKSMDVILLCDVLHHDQRNALALMQESARVAKIIIVKDHFESSSYSRTMLKVMDFVGNRGYGIAIPHEYFTIEGFTKLYLSAGLKSYSLDIGINLYSHLFLLRWLLNPKWQFLAVLET